MNQICDDALSKGKPISSLFPTIEQIASLKNSYSLSNQQINEHFRRRRAHFKRKSKSKLKLYPSYKPDQTELPPIFSTYPFPLGFTSKGTNLTNKTTTKKGRIKICGCNNIGKDMCVTYFREIACDPNETTCNNVRANDTTLHTVIECNEFNCCYGKVGKPFINRYRMLVASSMDTPLYPNSTSLLWTSAVEYLPALTSDSRDFK